MSYRIKPQKPWRQAAPYRYTWTDALLDALEILGGVVILTILLFGVPFLILTLGAS